MHGVKQIVIPNRPHGCLFLGTTQLNFASGAWTKILLDTIAANCVDGIEDTANNRITPGVAGWYEISASLYVSAGMVDTVSYLMSLYKNGAGGTQIGLGSIQASGTAEHTIVIPRRRYLLTATDYLELFLYHGSAATVDAAANQAGSWLDVARVR